MRFTTAAAATAFTRLAAAAVHGEGALGTTMGPVDFLWPYSRAWSAETDNIAPCGSPEGPTKRTNFPLSKSDSESLLFLITGTVLKPQFW